MDMNLIFYEWLLTISFSIFYLTAHSHSLLVKKKHTDTHNGNRIIYGNVTKNYDPQSGIN